MQASRSGWQAFTNVLATLQPDHCLIKVIFHLASSSYTSDLMTAYTVLSGITTSNTDSPDFPWDILWPCRHAAYCNSSQQRHSLPVLCIYGSIIDDWLQFIIQLSAQLSSNTFSSWILPSALLNLCCNFSHALHGPQYHCQWHNHSSWQLHPESSEMRSYHAVSFTPGCSADCGTYLMAHVGHELATVQSHEYIGLFLGILVPQTPSPLDMVPCADVTPTALVAVDISQQHQPQVVLVCNSTHTLHRNVMDSGSTGMGIQTLHTAQRKGNCSWNEVAEFRVKWSETFHQWTMSTKHAFGMEVESNGGINLQVAVIS